MQNGSTAQKIYETLEKKGKEMTFHTFLIKYGEIGIKGKNRYLFEDALVNQIKFALKDVDGEFDVYKTQ